MRYPIFAGLMVFALSAQAQYAPMPAPEPTREELALQQAQTAAYHAYLTRTAEALAADGGARELALAAILHRLGAETAGDAMPAGDAPSRAVAPDAGRQAWLRTAAARASDDVIANRLLVAAAADAAPSTRIEAARRWQAADPGSLVPLLSTGLTTEALLVEARRATHADARMYEAVRWIMSTLQRHPPTAAEQAVLAGEEPYRADEAAALSAMGIWAAAAMPGYLPLQQACGSEALRATPTRHADCRHVASLLAERSGSAGDQGLGLALLRELAGDGAERSDIDARRRRMDWQMLQWGRIASSQPRDGAAQFVRLLADPAIGTERQLMERVLQEAGVPLEPPAGWAPPRR